MQRLDERMSEAEHAPGGVAAWKYSSLSIAPSLQPGCEFDCTTSKHSTTAWSTDS